MITQHTKNYPYVCDICGRGFVKKYLLVAHNEAIHEEAKFVCEVCGKVCNSRHYLHKHLKMHKSDENSEKRTGSVCEICGKVFLYLKDHKKVHVEPSIMCEVCGKIFVCKSYLDNHIAREHTKRKVYACEICKKKFMQKKSLRQHVLNRHIKKQKLGVSSKKVRKGALKRKTFEFDGEERSYQCHLCGWLYTSASGLRTHLREHADGKVFTCKFCEGEFETRNLLKDHECPVPTGNFKKESIRTEIVTKTENFGIEQSAVQNG